MARYNRSYWALDKDEDRTRAAVDCWEPEAFDRFVEHFRAKVFHYSWLMCRNREDAEEVAQETLLKVFENFDQLANPSGSVRGSSTSPRTPA